MEGNPQKQELTLEDLKAIIASMVEQKVNEKGLVKLGDLKAEIESQLRNVVTADLRPAMEAELKKLSRLPGAGGTIDIGKSGDNDLKGLEKNGGYSSIMEFAADVARAYTQGREPTAKFLKWRADVKAYQEVIKAAGDPSLTIQDPEYGGELVPPEYATALLERGLVNADFAPLCTPVPMARNLINMPYIQDFDHSGGYVYGAMNSYWTDELGTKLPSVPKFGHIGLKLHKLVVLVYSSDELLEDSTVSMEPLLQKKAPETIGWRLDKAILTGTGGAQPVGAISAANPALISITKESGQAADTIVAENVIKMYSRMHPRNLKTAVWVANLTCFPQIATMSLRVGTGGIPVYLPANGLANQPFDTLMGKRIIWTEHSPVVGDKGDLALIDFGEYMLAQKRGAGSGIQYAQSIHLMFLYDQTAFRFVLRVDGQPWWPKPFTPANGDTLSPFIVIDARA